MAGKLEVNVTRPTFAVELLDEVRAHGFSAELRAGDADATVEIETNGGPGASSRDLWLTVETWLDAQSVPLIPLSLDEAHLVLRPPTG